MDDFSPEEMREFNENLNAMNASMGGLSQGLQQLSQTINNLDQTSQQSAKESEQTSKRSSDAENKKSEKNTEAAKVIETTAEKMKVSLNLATNAVTSFAGALTSGVEGFDKYTSAVSGFGDSARNTGAALGGFGKAIGLAVDLVSKFTVITMKQADAQNEFAKQMNRMGAVVDTTTQGLADAAREAGASAGDLQELAAVITQSSEALASFGAGTSEGTAKMLKVFKLSDDQEREMRRYGLTLREAQEQQAYYIELQRTSGVNMQAQEMSEQQIRLRSLKYAKTLTTLSELTGVQAGRLKEEQAAVQADLRNKIRNMRDQNDIERLKKQLDGDITAEKRASIEAEIKSRNQEIEVRVAAGNQFAGLLGQDMAAKVMNVIGTGAFDENTKELANLGLNAGELAKRFEGLTVGSDEYKQAIAETTGELVGGVRRNVDRFGKSMELAANASEIGAAVGINDATTDKAMKFMSEESAIDRVLSSFDEVAESTEKGADKQKDLAAELQVVETNVRTAADDFLNSMNPFTGALGLGTLAMAGLTTAAGVAATALYGMSGSGGIVDMLLGGGKKGGAGGAARKFLTKGATKFAAPLAAGMAIYGGYAQASEGRDQADSTLNATLLDENADAAEKQRAKEQHEIDTKQANRKGAGTGVGGAGGALAGAAAGAAIGSIVPFIGTAIGGIIGGALGAYGGAAGGGMVGEMLSPDDLDATLKSDAEFQLMSKEEQDEYTELRRTIEEQTEKRNAEERRLSKLTTDKIEENGLYTKNGWLQDSEVNFEKLAQMRDAGKLETDMLEAMLRDNDLSEKDTELVQQQLDLLKAKDEKDEAKDKKEKDVAEVKEPGEVSGRTLDMSPENLAKIFEADLKATAKNDAEKQAEADSKRIAVVKAKEESINKQITSEVIANALNDTGSGSPASKIDTAKLLEASQVQQNLLADASPTGIPTADALEKVETRLSTDDILKEVQVSNEKVATLIDSPAIKKTVTDEPMNEATREFVDWADSDEGKAEIAQNEKIRAEKMAEMKTSAENQMLAKEDQYREVLDTGKYKGKDASESMMGQAEKYLASIEETKNNRMAMDQSGLLNAPQVDIEPEPVEEAQSVDEFRQEQFAQTAPEAGEMTEYEKRSLALQEQQIAKLARIDNATTETADGTQKIATYSSV